MGYALCSLPHTAIAQIVSCDGTDFVSAGERLAYRTGFVLHQRDTKSPAVAYLGAARWPFVPCDERLTLEDFHAPRIANQRTDGEFENGTFIRTISKMHSAGFGMIFSMAES